jgi:membrane protein DedA with SNARE-associated domain
MKLLADFLTSIIQSYGVFAVFLLMTAESCLIPIPSEVTMPFAGFLAGRGILSFPVVVLVGAVGNLAGSLLAYWLGAAKGEPWIRTAIRKWGKWLLLKESDFDKGKLWLERYGNPVVFVSRLLPIVRTFVSLPAGIAKNNIVSFSVLTFIGSLLWSTLLAWLGLKLGENWTSIEPYFRQFQFVIAGLILVAIAVYIWSHLKRRDQDRKEASKEASKEDLLSE